MGFSKFHSQPQPANLHSSYPQGRSRVYSRVLSNLLWLGLTLHLSGCSTPSVTLPSSAQFQIQPNPAEPGVELKVLGLTTLPPLVELDGAVLPIQTVTDGYLLRLPIGLLAGMHPIKVAGQQFSLTILPKITGTLIAEDQLQIGGLGWTGANPLNTFLWLDNQKQVPELNEGLLKIPLLERPFGDFALRVSIAGFQSTPYLVKYRAATAKGKVVGIGGVSPSLSQTRSQAFGLSSSAVPEPFPNVQHPFQPATGQFHRLSSTPNLQQVRALIVHCSNTCPSLEVLNTLDLFTSPDRTSLNPKPARVQNIPGFNAQRWEWNTLEEAQNAFSLLSEQPWVSLLEWDGRLHTDALESHPVDTQVGTGVFPLSSQANTLQPSTLQASNPQWFWDQMGVPEAQKRSQGEGVIVAVVDTGVSLEHPALKANLLPGYDFVNGDNFPEDQIGHGTHVSGLIAANDPNHRVSGAAPKAKILPVKVLNGLEGGSYAKVAEGLLWAAGLHPTIPNPYPAQIVNISLGSPEYSLLVSEAIARLIAKNIVVVAAAGNSGGNVQYPAALEGVLSVTALAGSKTHYQPSYACKGVGLRITAIGGDFGKDDNGDGVEDAILSTDLSSGQPGYGLRAGTSMAAPQVAGIAALALSSGTPIRNLKSQLEHSAQDLGVAGYDLDFGYGLVDARVVSSDARHTYVLALDSSGKVRSWTLALSDGSFTLFNLPPDHSLRILAATDNNSNGVLAEAGETISDLQSLTPNTDALYTLDDLYLHSSDGRFIIPLSQE